MVSLSIRVDLSQTRGLGPGKIRLLEMIEETGSISAAGRAMDMSYRRAWLLLDELNHTFHEPVATTAHGGRSGGGASLTPFGEALGPGLSQDGDRRAEGRGRISGDDRRRHRVITPRPRAEAQPREIAPAPPLTQQPFDMQPDSRHPAIYTTEYLGSGPCRPNN